jgi:hypothetical protein
VSGSGQTQNFSIFESGIIHQPFYRIQIIVIDLDNYMLKKKEILFLSNSGEPAPGLSSAPFFLPDTIEPTPGLS